MTHSRNKGRNAEREVERILQDAGLQTDRNLSGREQVAGDIVVYMGDILAIEVRRRETLSIDKWSRDHEESTPDDFIPAVVYRRSRAPWRISLRLDDFLALVTNQRSKSG